MSKGSGGTRIKVPNGSSRIGDAERAYMDVINNSISYTSQQQREIRRSVYTDAQEKLIDNDWATMASAQDMQAVIPYIRGSYDLNNALNNGDTLTDKQKEVVRNLESSMKPLKKDVIVYMGWMRGYFTDMPSFKSTSMNIKTAASFASLGGGIKAFKIPKGTKVAFGKSIEQEIILPRSFKLSKHEIK